MVTSANNRPLIGILGGTFDPVHHGHLRLAIELLETLPLDHIRLIPSQQPPHRPAPEASAAQRLALLTTAIATLFPLASSTPPLMVDDCELKRSGPSYTVDTLRHLRQQWGTETPLALIVGWDAFMGLSNWHQWLDLLTLAHVVVCQRPGWTALPAIMQTCLQQHQTQNPQALTETAAGRIWIQEIPLLAISASQIRQRLHQGRCVRYLLPDAVLQQIRQTHCYPTTTPQPDTLLF